jgi:metal-responsive CopG/Arc/MetJ family transcriptional regulator
MQRGIPSIKTAVSLKRSLYDQVDKLAKDMSIPRSQVFVLALEAFVVKHHNRLLLQQINNAFADQPKPQEQKRIKSMRRSHRKIVEGEW